MAATVQKLETAALPANEVVYLDTSVIFTLAQLEAKKKGLKVPPDRNGARVEAFLRRIAKSGASGCTTIVAIEELAAKVRNVARASAAKRSGHSSWGEYKRQAGSQAVVADAQAQHEMLLMMQCAMDRMNPLGVFLDMPEVGAQESREVARRLRRAHRKLLRQYVELDAMDALHIVLGVDLGMTTFMTFDGGWSAVDGLRILC